MKIDWVQLYQNLQDDLALCRQKKLPFEKEVEACFSIAEKYWKRVKELVTHYPLDNGEDEIQFFKIWKPKFTSEIEYYNLIYHSILFQPADCESAALFWAREAGRLQKFKEENSVFYAYYSAKRCEMDEAYFKRAHYDLRTVLETKIIDAGSATAKNGDVLVAALMALERYREYVLQKIEVE